ncbi:hypothetical protein AMAG_12067 [Allomyces macrogynus ATCC 38327]|uniref:Uncharacterized protein n=1 Tax=Allomyces macrogynus (strain ATCC 38327) TaxID=578462 RepID=A0A0L0SYJ0_ALLM3|nr:hypothetical protein AMAG_12067 [Allomyces macrogynus ATCC 38327]|eukprot:KNE67613.1 hypothetical protein AMAG_12067 [Allomyces macrogynus ATCC 38327]
MTGESSTPRAQGTDKPAAAPPRKPYQTGASPNPTGRQPGWTSPFAFRLPKLTREQLELINKYSSRGWGGLFIACAVGASIGYSLHAITDDDEGSKAKSA